MEICHSSYYRHSSVLLQLYIALHWYVLDEVIMLMCIEWAHVQWIVLYAWHSNYYRYSSVLYQYAHQCTTSYITYIPTHVILLYCAWLSTLMAYAGHSHASIEQTMTTAWPDVACYVAIIQDKKLLMASVMHLYAQNSRPTAVHWCSDAKSSLALLKFWFC